MAIFFHLSLFQTVCCKINVNDYLVLNIVVPSLLLLVLGIQILLGRYYVSPNPGNLILPHSFHSFMEGHHDAIVLVFLMHFFFRFFGMTQIFMPFVFPCLLFFCMPRFISSCVHCFQRIFIQNLFYRFNKHKSLEA